MKGFYCAVLMFASSLIALPVSAAWSVKLDKSLDLSAAGWRDFNNSRWLAGVEKKLIGLQHDGHEHLYLSGVQAWSADSGRGIFGASFGVNTGKAGEILRDLGEKLAPEHPGLLKPLETAANFVSVEFLVGRRIFGQVPGEKPLVWGIGGKVRIPLDLLLRPGS